MFDVLSTSNYIVKMKRKFLATSANSQNSMQCAVMLLRTAKKRLNNMAPV